MKNKIIEHISIFIIISAILPSIFISRVRDKIFSKKLCINADICSLPNDCKNCKFKKYSDGN